MVENHETSRRSALKKAAATVSVTVVGGIAGCNSSDGDGSGGGGSEDSGSDGGSGDGGSSSSSEQTESGGQKQSIASITRLSNAYWKSWVKGYREAAEALGYTSQVELNEGSLTKQFEQIDTAISGGTSAIAASTFTNAGVPEVARIATESNVPFVNTWTIADWSPPEDFGTEFLQMQMANSFDNAYNIAKILFDEMEGSGLIHIEGVRGDASNRGRNLGLEKALSETSEVERLNEPIEGNWTRSGGRQAMSDLASKFGDEIAGVFAQNDGIALGALNILNEEDMDVPLVGTDAIPAAIEAIENDEMTATNSPVGPWQGGWSLVKCHDFNNGWEPMPGERMIFTGGPTLTKKPEAHGELVEKPTQRARNYNETIYQGESTPFDWEKMSVVEAGEDSWDPQLSVTPMRFEDLQQVLTWTEENKPDDYELPSVYRDSTQIDKVEQMYADHFNENPLV